jgi:UDP-N-acetylglucosamine--N-acetylmuramyl-(pentapeptide) pyrophosphoryl-undecaprenol N-acetylglucosamine transferase
MEVALGAASAAITRAGASSLAELAAMRVPAVLIPYPHAAENHQFYNACAFESTGAAVLMEQESLEPEHLLAALRPMVEDPEVRSRMQSALEPWHRPEAAERIARMLLGLPAMHSIRPAPAGASTGGLPASKAMVA